MSDTKFDRYWCMPNKNTFTMLPVKRLLEEELIGQDMERWADPFCGLNSPAKWTNDLNPEVPAKFHLDALSFLQRGRVNWFEGILYDPPYSYTQAAICYKSFGKDKLNINVANDGYWAACKNTMSNLIRSGGKIICFGWNSGGLGLKRGFNLERIILLAHGGHHNDTIITVETKI